MLLGRNLVPFSTPPQASGAFRPSMPQTHFYSNMRPFSTMRRMPSASGWYPTPHDAIGPAPMMPIAPPAPPSPMTPGAAASPIPASAVMHGAFGSTGGVKAHFHMSPYAVMRQGMIPGIHPNASHLHAGVRNAHAWVDQSMPFQTAPLPPPPPPPPVAVAPGGTKGFFGALLGNPHHRRARKRHWWQFTPPSTEEQAFAEQPACEWITDSVSGIQKQICNGRVVAYRDASGNTVRPGEYGAYGQGQMSGLGFSWPGAGWRHRGLKPHRRHHGF